MNRDQFDRFRVRVPRVAWGLLLTLALAACADITLNPSPLSPVAPETLVLSKEVEGRSSAGYNRTLRAGSNWRRIGTIAEGEVYKPLDAPLTVEGTHVREAYMVTRDGRWVGFWLPNEEAFTVVSEPEVIDFQAK